jgi:hypothetical protein
MGVSSIAGAADGIASAQGASVPISAMPFSPGQKGNVA